MSLLIGVITAEEAEFIGWLDRAKMPRENAWCPRAINARPTTQLTCIVCLPSWQRLPDAAQVLLNARCYLIGSVRSAPLVPPPEMMMPQPMAEPGTADNNINQMIRESAENYGREILRDFAIRIARIQPDVVDRVSMTRIAQLREIHIRREATRLLRYDDRRVAQLDREYNTIMHMMLSEQMRPSPLSAPPRY